MGLGIPGLWVAQPAGEHWHHAGYRGASSLVRRPDRLAGPRSVVDSTLRTFYAIVGSRLFAEFEHSWLSRSLLVLTGACYIGSLVLWLPDLTLLGPEWKGLVSEAVQLVGHLLLTLAIAVEARKVVQEIQCAARIPTFVGRSRQRTENVVGVIAVDPAHRHPAGMHFSSAPQIPGNWRQPPGD